MSAPQRVSRRTFLARAGAASIGAGVALSGLRVDGADAAVCDPLGYRSLVCVFLAGGADSFNMFVPYNFAEAGSTWQTYAATRGDIAVPRSNLLPVGDNSFAFNAGLPSMAEMYDRGDLAVVSNVGPLAGPTTPADIQAGRGVPQSLFAHDAQQRLWQNASTAVGGTTEGWGGRIAQEIQTCDANALVPSAISALGSSTWQDTSSGGYLRLSPSFTLRRMAGYDPTVRGHMPQHLRSRVAAAMDDVLRAGESSDRELERLVARTTRTSILTNAELEEVTSDNSIDLGPIGLNRLKAQLRLVAQLINNRERLNMSRQVFFVTMGGWDTHRDQNERLVDLFAGLNDALASFQNALGVNGMNVANSVTTFTVSDFGRTLTSNGNGTDHAWGGHAFVMGGAVNGGRWYGDIPSFASVNNPNDTGTGRSFTGRLVPTTSVGQYGATLARWAGVDDSRLDDIFPDLANFSTRDLGFMS